MILEHYLSNSGFSATLYHGSISIAKRFLNLAMRIITMMYQY